MGSTVDVRQRKERGERLTNPFSEEATTYEPGLLRRQKLTNPVF
jgi:hypothetical protein